MAIMQACFQIAPQATVPVQPWKNETILLTATRRIGSFFTGTVSQKHSLCVLYTWKALRQKKLTDCQIWTVITTVNN